MIKLLQSEVGTLQQCLTHAGADRAVSSSAGLFISILCTDVCVVWGPDCHTKTTSLAQDGVCVMG